MKRLVSVIATLLIGILGAQAAETVPVSFQLRHTRCNWKNAKRTETTCVFTQGTVVSLRLEKQSWTGKQGDAIARSIRKELGPDAFSVNVEKEGTAMVVTVDLDQASEARCDETIVTFSWRKEDILAATKNAMQAVLGNEYALKE